MDYRKLSADRHKTFDGIAPRFLYNDDGAYMYIAIPYDLLTPDSFVAICGDPVPCDTEKDFYDFMGRLKHSHDIVVNGKNAVNAGDFLFPKPFEYALTNQPWKYRTNRVPE